MMDLKALTSEICEIAKETGSYIKEKVNCLHNEEVQAKSLNNFVTSVDKNSEKILIERLSILIPGSGFIAEENSVDYIESEYVWIIDPLDGTTNFIHGVPMYCISIGLMHNKILVSGVIYEINLNECFYAWKAGGAWLNGKPINVSETRGLKDSLLGTGFPYHNFNLLENYLGLFRYCLENTHGVRRLGSAAADLAYVACGRYDGFFEYGLSPWDVAAGCLIVREAGGSVGDFSGGCNYVFGKQIIAANNNIYVELLEKAKKYFQI